MTVIALEGMQFFAFHGFYDEEQKMGGYFLLDVYIHLTEKTEKTLSDKLELEHTVNYESIYFVCKTEMKKTSKLIEDVAARIATKVKSFNVEKIEKVKVRLRKLNPPLGGIVHSAYVEIEVEKDKDKDKEASK
jgi:dihydroneopterin aldolase